MSSTLICTELPSALENIASSSPTSWRRRPQTWSLHDGRFFDAKESLSLVFPTCHSKSVLVGAAVVAWSLRVNGCMSLAAELTVLSIVLCPVGDELRVVEPRAITRDFQ